MPKPYVLELPYITVLCYTKTLLPDCGKHLTVCPYQTAQILI